MVLRGLVFLYFILFSSSVFSKEIPIIVITANKTPQSKSTVGSDVEVIDNKTLKNSNEFFLGDALAGNAPTMSFGGRTDKSNMGTKMAAGIGWDGFHFWVGEYKFSNRLLGFAPSK